LKNPNAVGVPHATMKPSIFIGSSSEALPLAEAVQVELSKHFGCDLWNEHLFELGDDTLNNLLRFVQSYDFAVLVVTDDDTTTSRKYTKASPRDNVILELGLFMGALGRRHAFPVIAQTTDGAPKLPSDLLGNTAIYLPKNLRKVIDPVQLENHLAPLIRAIEQRSQESTLQLLPSTGLAIGYFQNFVLPVCQELARRTHVQVGGTDVDIRQDNFDFTIVLPAALSDASIQGARKFTKKQNADDFSLKTDTRTYPFYVNSSVVGGRVTFYDYPTTLRASHEAVRIALAGAYLGYGNHHAVLDKKEIYNFERTLRLLLRDGTAAEFRDNVKFIQMT
jgi:predicted nucleotide-binding protein